MVFGIKSLNRVNILVLMGFGSHLGSLDLKEWNAESSSYIYSRLKSRFIINLSFTSFAIGKSIKFLNFCAIRKLRTLFFFKDGFTGYLDKLSRSNWFWSKNFFLINKWIPGSLTNYKSTRSKILKFRNLTNFTEYPNVLVFLDSTRFLSLASSESRSVRLPSVGFADTDSGFAPFAYSIPGNNKSFTTLFAYYTLYFNAILNGWVTSNFVYWNSTREIVSKYLRFFKVLGVDFTHFVIKNKVEDKSIFFVKRKNRPIVGTDFFKPRYKKIFNLSKFFIPQVYFYGGKLMRMKFKHNMRRYNNRNKYKDTNYDFRIYMGNINNKYKNSMGRKYTSNKYKNNLNK